MRWYFLVLRKKEVGIESPENKNAHTFSTEQEAKLSLKAQISSSSPGLPIGNYHSLCLHTHRTCSVSHPNPNPNPNHSDSYNPTSNAVPNTNPRPKPLPHSWTNRAFLRHIFLDKVRFSILVSIIRFYCRVEDSCFSLLLLQFRIRVFHFQYEQT